MGVSHKEEATWTSAEERFSRAVISCDLERRDKCVDDHATRLICSGFDSIAIGRKTKRL